MTEYLKIEFEVRHLEDVAGRADKLNSVLVSMLDDAGLSDLDDYEKPVTGLERPQELAVVETAVVLGLIGVAKSVIELYKFLKESELEEKKINLERAKLELERQSDAEKQELRESFVRDDLPQILLRADITNVTNVVTSIVVQE